MNQGALRVLMAGGPQSQAWALDAPELPCSYWGDSASPPSTLDGEQARPRCPLILLALLHQAWGIAFLTVLA